MQATQSITLNINGQTHSLDVEPRFLLSDVLRHKLGLTGTHVGCEHGVCGACTVLVDGKPERSCLVFAIQAEGSSVETIEGLSADGMTRLQRAFQEHHALQCGFCTPAFLLTATALLKQTKDPTEQDIREAISGNICRCTGYQFIVDAILAAAKGEEA
ncbi:(2Fe-2S)-binding protein [Ferroacidibacillus organovorans]|uniref:(2Fe-2S)-binding protein n=1 Tax=Ferroacidibacillus organovorans TaxID=1765683 RepID=A0A162T768_9BACL|nr:(2Fe-2S)-binding protein [Ferroacidibacillus organovorans]OAG94759.1 (2Fe-2S)-binding protein [Ferroacidibacillus organovorans]OPG16666.1 (2Fe-2S)-binding protein [Ferroacidibacillus organovorans]